MLALGVTRMALSHKFYVLSFTRFMFVFLGDLLVLSQNARHPASRRALKDPDVKAELCVQITISQNGNSDRNSLYRWVT